MEMGIFSLAGPIVKCEGKKGKGERRYLPVCIETKVPKAIFLSSPLSSINPTNQPDIPITNPLLQKKKKGGGGAGISAPFIFIQPLHTIIYRTIHQSRNQTAHQQQQIRMIGTNVRFEMLLESRSDASRGFCCCCGGGEGGFHVWVGIDYCFGGGRSGGCG